MSEHTARLDQRTLDLAERLIESDADELRLALTHMRETWDGSDSDTRTPAEAFRAIAVNANEIARILDTYEEAEHIVRDTK